MTNNQLYDLKQVEALTGIPKNTLRTRLNRKVISGKKIMNGAKPEWFLSQETVDTLLGITEGPVYEALIVDWQEEQRNGYHTGKHLAEDTIYANNYGMSLFWQHCGHAQRVQNITVENLKKALASVKIDHEKKNCHFSQRDQMYKGFMSFYKLLVRRGLREESDLLKFKSFKPRRKYTAKKTVIQKGQIQGLLVKNETYRNGRSKFDVALTRTILHLFIYSGIRIEELIELTLENVDMDNQILYVVDGKGGKNREVGLSEEVLPILAEWLEKYRPGSKKDRSQPFLLTKTGKPILHSNIQKRVKRICKKAGIPDLSPHSFRLGYATILSSLGVSVEKIRLLLGHASITTTQGYLKEDLRAAIASSQDLKLQAVPLAEQVKQAREKEQRQKRSQAEKLAEWRYRYPDG